MNKAFLVGNISTDIDIRTTNSGVKLASFNLAVSRDFKDADGKRGTDFIPVTVWRNTAEYVEKYASKGDKIAVSGRIQIDSYTDKEGNRRTKTWVVADSVDLTKKPQDRLNSQPGFNFEDKNHAQSGISSDDGSSEFPF